MKKKLIAGNWKMNGGLAANQALLQALLQDVAMPACDVAVAVPAAYLAQGQALLQGSPISLAAQDVSQHEVGAYTDSGESSESAEDSTRRAQILREIEIEIQGLPTRQREAFLMRYWEEMDVAETAAAMGCSEGSVKTHCSRAVQALSRALTAKGIQP